MRPKKFGAQHFGTGTRWSRASTKGDLIMDHQTQDTQIAAAVDGLTLSSLREFETGKTVVFVDRSNLTLPPEPVYDPQLTAWTCPETGIVGMPVSAREIVERIEVRPDLFGERNADCIETIYPEEAFYSEIAADILTTTYLDGLLLKDPEHFKAAIERAFPKIFVTDTDEGLIAFVPVPATERGDICGEFTGTDYDFFAAIDTHRPFNIHLSVDKHGSVVWRKGHKSEGRGIIRDEEECFIEEGFTYAERASLRNEMSATFFKRYYQEAIQIAYIAFLISQADEYEPAALHTN